MGWPRERENDEVKVRPDPVGPGMESVWDYPRPPRLEPVHLRIRVVLGGETIADTLVAYRLLETSHPPKYYLPPDALAPGTPTEGGLGLRPTDSRVYPGRMDVCFVGDEKVVAPPKGFYGGWITSAVAGPFKGAPGTERW